MNLDIENLTIKKEENLKQNEIAYQKQLSEKYNTDRLFKDKWCQNRYMDTWEEKQFRKIARNCEYNYK